MHEFRIRYTKLPSALQLHEYLVGYAILFPVDLVVWEMLCTSLNVY
jgi:hypothetical protein